MVLPVLVTMPGKIMISISDGQRTFLSKSLPRFLADFKSRRKRLVGLTVSKSYVPARA